MMVQLQSNVPVPKKRRVRDDDGRKKYPFETMEVGHFFFVPNKQHSSIRTYFSTAGKQHGIKLKSEQTFARLVLGPTPADAHWELCSESAPGAVSGVGVWRTE